MSCMQADKSFVEKIVPFVINIYSNDYKNVGLMPSFHRDKFIKFSWTVFKLNIILLKISMSHETTRTRQKDS